MKSSVLDYDKQYYLYLKHNGWVYIDGLMKYRFLDPEGKLLSFENFCEQYLVDFANTPSVADKVYNEVVRRKVATINPWGNSDLTNPWEPPQLVPEVAPNGV